MKLPKSLLYRQLDWIEIFNLCPMSQNRKYNVQFGKSQKGTQTKIFFGGLGKCFKKTKWNVLKRRNGMSLLLL